MWYSEEPWGIYQRPDFLSLRGPLEWVPRQHACCYLRAASVHVAQWAASQSLFSSQAPQLQDFDACRPAPPDRQSWGLRLFFRLWLLNLQSWSKGQRVLRSPEPDKSKQGGSGAVLLLCFLLATMGSDTSVLSGASNLSGVVWGPWQWARETSLWSCCWRNRNAQPPCWAFRSAKPGASGCGPAQGRPNADSQVSQCELSGQRCCCSSFLKAA